MAKSPYQKQIDELRRDLAAQALEFAAFKELAVVEITSLRMEIMAQGIRPPPSALDDNCMSTAEFAKANFISEVTVWSRISRGKLAAEKRGGRWRIPKMHSLQGGAMQTKPE